MSRSPIVAGQFYSANRQKLQQEVLTLLGNCSRSQPALGVVVPHAGYAYSGATAGATFAQVDVPNTVVLLGPNHRGIGAECAVYNGSSWATPLGSVNVDTELAAAIIDGVDDMCADNLAHQYEHSLEVMLPFLQVRNPQLQIVPISLMAISYERIEQIASQLSGIIQRQSAPVLIVASSDMSHYEPVDTAEKKDKFALEAVLNLDAKKLYQRVTAKHITMCGMGAVVLMLLTLTKCGASRAELIQYTNSGEVSGDYDQVVGYAGVVIS
ncbi:MAG: AmmeMemoRadiSam system protein B [Desulfuromonas sp.]|nr:AmmeMemoRadiSam system protein B [Desulfuromonas sp.]